MRRRLGIALVCSVVIASPFVMVGVAGAAKIRGSASGQVSCAMTGIVSYKPSLTAVAKPTVASIRATLRCPSGISGIPGVGVSEGKLIGTSPSYAARCAAPNPPGLGASIRWIAKGAKLADSQVLFGAATGGTNPISHTFRSVRITGSYAGRSATAVFPGQASGACGTKSIKNWRFAGAPLSVTGCGTANAAALGLGQYNGTNRPDDLHVWYLVQPSITYGPQCRPTGTMSVTYRNPEICPALTNVPVTSSDSYTTSTTSNPYAPYYGIVSAYTLAYEGDVCGGFRNIRYSGDAVYRAFFVGIP